MTSVLNAMIGAPGTFTGLPWQPNDPKQRLWPQHHNIEALFTYGSGGTSVDVFLQTTHDGANWRDIGHFGQLTTSTARDIWRASSSDSVLDADIQNPAPHVSWLRVRYTVVGVYAGTNLAINVIVDLVRAGVGP
jgi:hypothetical protein